MATRARKKINLLSLSEAIAERNKLVSDGHFQMVRTKQLNKRIAYLETL